MGSVKWRLLESVARGFPVALAGIALAYGVFTSGLLAKYYDAFWFDGPLQLFTTLRRLDAHERPFRDFPVFHGIALPYLFWPLYRLGGGTLFASEFWRQFVPYLAFLLSSLAVLRTLGARRDQALGFAAAYACLLPLLALLPSGTVTTNVQIFLGTADSFPMNSLRGLRAGIALISICMVALADRRWGSLYPARVGAVAGLASGVSMAHSYEQGAAASVATALFLLGRSAMRHDPSRKRWAAQLAFFSMLLLVVGLFFTVCSAGHPLAALRYAYRTIPREQFWYFGVPPNPFPERWKDFLNFYGLGQVTLGAGAGVALMVWATWAARTGRITWQQWSTLAYLLVFTLIGSLSVLAMVDPSYYMTYMRVATLTTGWALGMSVKDRLRWSLGPWSKLVLLVAVLGCTVMSGWTQAHVHLERFADGSHYSPELGVHLREQMGELIELAAFVKERAPGAASLWSTYGGMLEVLSGQFQPSRSDYIIHALGREGWGRYLATFRERAPFFVTTVAPRSFVYEEWLWISNWEFYRELLTHYAPERVGRLYTLWARSRSVEVGRAGSCPRGRVIEPPAPGATTLVLPVIEGERLLEATVHYRVERPFAWVPLLGQTSRYFVRVVGAGNNWPVSLPPYRRTHTFPVFVTGKPGDVMHVFAHFTSLVPGASWMIERLELCPLELPEDRVAALVGNTLGHPPRH